MQSPWWWRNMLLPSSPSWQRRWSNAFALAFQCLSLTFHRLCLDLPLRSASGRMPACHGAHRLERCYGQELVFDAQGASPPNSFSFDPLLLLLLRPLHLTFTFLPPNPAPLRPPPGVLRLQQKNCQVCRTSRCLHHTSPSHARAYSC